MSVQRALLIELFAILLALYGGFTVLAPNTLGDPVAIYAGLYLGFFGLVYGLVGARVVGALQNDT